MLVQEVSFQELLKKMNHPTTLCVPLVRKSEDIISSVIKLANSQGGTVILGFDRSNLCFPGTQISAEWVHIVIKNDCQPEIEFKIKEVFHAKKKALLIEVQEGFEKPYTLSGNSQPLPQIIVGEAPSPTIQTTTKDIKKSLSDRGQIFSTEAFNELTRREKKALNYLKKNNSISNKEYRDINKVSAKTAHNELSKMIALGFLKQQGEGRLTRYVLISDELGTPQTSTTNENPDNITTTDKTDMDNTNIEKNSQSFDPSATSIDTEEHFIDPEDDGFMDIFNDGIDFIEKLSEDTQVPKKKIIPLNTKIPLFDLNEENHRLTKTALRAEGSLDSHLPE